MPVSSRPVKLVAGLAACAAVLLAGCAERAPGPTEPPAAMCPAPNSAAAAAPAAVAAPAAPQPLDSAFAAAAAEFDVPAPLLKAIGYVETRWQMVESHPEFPGQPVVYGLMGLKDGQLALGAALAGITSEAARTEPAQNVRAAAALLRRYADELGVERAELGAWAPAVARYSAIALPAGQAAYVHHDVYATLRRGVADTETGELRATLAPLDVRAELPVPATPMAGTGVDYAGAVWRASPNFNARPTGEIGRVAMVIIHTCEGAYTGCWSWLANPDSRVSAHYVVKEDGSEITQLVRDAERAWHIGSTYDCALNRGFECWRNGSSNNHFTIGIEHAGYASQSTWPAAQLDASARLVCDLARRHGIARDDLHILGHAQLQPHNRTDPGRNWPWAEFYARIEAHCGGGTNERVIDSHGGDAAAGYLTVSAAWTSTRLTPGYYGDGYYFAPTGDAADPAVFHFYLPEPTTRTVDAWWTAGTNRSPAATFVARDASGRVLGTARADQQANGSRWNTLGSWHFPAGWNTIELSRQGPAGCVVIADAVRLR